MTGTITTGSFPKALVPGIKAWTHHAYAEHPMECVGVFGDLERSRRKYEETVEMTGFGMAPVKDEAGATSFIGHNQGPVTRYTHVAYGLGFIVTREERDDNLYAEVSRARSRKLAFAFRQTKETVAANILNRAFNSAYAGADGKELVATDHPVAGGGTQSNELAVAADLSEASLEDMLILIHQARDNMGLRIALQPQKLVVAPSESFKAKRILNSTLRPGTDQNDINALRGKLPGGAMTYHYLDDDDAFFVTTNSPDGLKGFQRTPFEVGRDGDFDTDNLKVKGYERYVFGWSDWRGIYGTPGA